MEVRAALTRKIGPLPVWVWGAVIGGGLLAFRYYREQGGSTAEGVTVPYQPSALTADSPQLVDPQTGLPYSFLAGQAVATTPAAAHTFADSVAEVTGAIDALGPLIYPPQPAGTTGDAAAAPAGKHKPYPPAGTRVTGKGKRAGKTGRVVYAHGYQYHVYGSGKNREAVRIRKAPGNRNSASPSKPRAAKKRAKKKSRR